MYGLFVPPNTINFNTVFDISFLETSCQTEAVCEVLQFVIKPNIFISMWGFCVFYLWFTGLCLNQIYLYLCAFSLGLVIIKNCCGGTHIRRVYYQHNACSLIRYNQIVTGRHIRGGVYENLYQI